MDEETIENDDTSLKKLSVAFIGAGMMASAIMDGLLAKKVVSSPEQLSCSDPFEGALTRASAKGIYTSTQNEDICNRNNDVIIIAVKPNNVLGACADIMKATTTSTTSTTTEHNQNNNLNTIIVSIAAGVTLETLEDALPGRKVVRVMPNTPCLVGQAASGYCLGKLASTEYDKNIVTTIFGAVGVALEIKEEYLLNSVTGLSGSGPAYVFEFIEALADGGVRVGLSRTEALMLAAQTVKGAAEMVLVTGQHPGQLKDQVCSPGGTTIAGVDHLEQGNFRSTVIQAVKAATRRSAVLGGATETYISKKFNL